MRTKIQTNINIEDSPLFSRVCDRMGTFFELESCKMNDVVGKGRRIMDDKGWVCIHLEPGLFFRTLDEVITKQNLNPEDLSFLDVGCGVGQKVFLAGLLKFRAFGLDLRAPFVNRAKELLKQFGIDTENYFDPVKEATKIFQADALKYDKYGNFDIIYFYSPISDGELQYQLEKRIAEQAKKGAIVIAFQAASKHLFSSNKPKGFSLNVVVDNDEELNNLGWRRMGNSPHIFIKD